MDGSVTYKLFVSHARCLDEAERFVARLPDAGIQTSSIEITETGTALGVHTGPGSLIIGLQPAELS